MTEENRPVEPPPLPVQPLYYNAPFEGGYAGPAPTTDDRNLAMLCHLLALFTGFIGPLIIWLIKKDQSPFVDYHGKESLNFQLTLLIAYMICGVLAFFCIGVVLAIGVMIGSVVLEILACIHASKGNAYRYPLTLRLVS